MDKRFVYFYFMKNMPHKIRELVPSHIRYWKEVHVKDYLGGPFGDKTGGIISFTSESVEKATDIIMNDPFIVKDILSDKWIKEWIVE